MPITMADTPEEIEERRLLYVGLTRARDRLVLSYSRARTPGAKARVEPSRFLDGTESVLGAAARSQPRRKKATAKEKAAAPTVCRVCGLEASQRPRAHHRAVHGVPADDGRAGSSRSCAAGGTRDRARGSTCPPTSFTDATLTAIAEREPGDTRGLSASPGSARPRPSAGTRFWRL